MRVSADATWAAGVRPTRIVFSTIDAGPATERMRIDRHGWVGIGATVALAAERFRVTGGAAIDTLFATAQTAPMWIAPAGNTQALVPLAATMLQITGPTAAASNANLLIEAYHQSAGGGSAILTGRNANWTAGVLSATVAAQQLLSLRGAGYGATAYGGNRAQINLTAAEAWTDTAQGADIRIQTTKAGTLANVEVLRITDAGALQFAITGPLIVTGAGAPAISAPAGSLYLRTDGAAGSRLYVNQNGASTWAAVAGV
jgi:hypothetical protein